MIEETKIRIKFLRHTYNDVCGLSTNHALKKECFKSLLIQTIIFYSYLQFVQTQWGDQESNKKWKPMDGPFQGQKELLGGPIYFLVFPKTFILVLLTIVCHPAKDPPIGFDFLLNSFSAYFWRCLSTFREINWRTR